MCINIGYGIDVLWQLVLQYILFVPSFLRHSFTQDQIVVINQNLAFLLEFWRGEYLENQCQHLENPDIKLDNWQF